MACLQRGLRRPNRLPSRHPSVKTCRPSNETCGWSVWPKSKQAPPRLISWVGLEGPNNVLALNALGVPAVAVCSNTVTEVQADKLAMLAREFGDDTVSLMFDLDLDREGENGAKQAAVELAARCRVRLAWTAASTHGAF
jgi:hypothetical protein